MMNQPLALVFIQESDLGIILDYRLSFNEHMAHTINKVICKTGIIQRSFQQMDKKCFYICIQHTSQTYVELQLIFQMVVISLHTLFIHHVSSQ